MLELDPFGLRADQAEPGKVIALENGGGQLQVELVVVGHDDAVAAWRQVCDFVDRLFTDDLGHPVGDEFGEFLFTRVDPAHPAGQRGEQGYQSPADMARAEHGDLRLHRGHRFEQQYGHAAAALAQAGAEAEALKVRRGALRFEHLPGDVQRLVFQVAAADGVEQTAGADHHLRACVARGRAAFLDDGHQHAGFATGLVVGEGVDPLVHDADPLQVNAVRFFVGAALCRDRGAKRPQNI
ncbi:hypothetical protein D9M71_586490 [compost metagenome]